jgi:hypothetical protein
MLRKMLCLGVLVFSSALAVTLLADASKIDTSTPKGTVKGVYDLILAGDFDGMNKLFATPATDKEKELFENGFSDDMYGPALSAALREKFPNGSFPSADKMVAYLKDSVDKMDEKIEGDSCTLSVPASTRPSVSGPASQPITLKKVDGQWKIAIAEGRFLRLPPAQFRELTKARVATIRGLITDIRAGKFATYEEAQTAMRQRMQETQQKFGPATGSAPASRAAR